jgi:AcrR family transcriptional regulator
MVKKRRDAGRKRGKNITDAVLDEAVRELAEHGFEGFSIERVAHGADLNKTSVYRRWPTREAVIAAALSRVRAGLSVALVDRGSLRADLLALAEDVAAVVESEPGKALLRAAFAAHGAPELQALATSALSRVAAADVTKLITRARRRGEWRRGLSPRPILTMLLGAIMHRVMLEHAPVDRRYLTRVVDVIVRGVACDAESPQAPTRSRGAPRLQKR